MAYKPNPNGPFVDRTYPSQIAAERPALVTRIHCFETPEPDETLLGGEQEMHTSERVDLFNRHLRTGRRE